MTGGFKRQWNISEIEQHLKSAVDSLTPSVLDRIDLSQPQGRADAVSAKGKSNVITMRGHIWAAGRILAACLCVICLAGGFTTVQNRKVDSVIGIDVNPSIELSVNRKDKVLKAKPLNSDAVEILDDMELKNVDLNIAMNALIGSMVKHGYLTDLDNAILVTVSNDDKQKAADMRQSVVSDIEQSLEENQVQAVVYDQQAEDTDAVREIAEKYGLSYGKAYFLQELIEQNEDLTEADLDMFSYMTMEEIAREITERSYLLGEKIDKTNEPATEAATGETTAAEDTLPAETVIPETTEPETTEPETTIPESTEPETALPTETAAPPVTEEETTVPPVTEEPTEESTEEEGTGKAKIDNVDYDEGILEVDFAEKVKWKNQAVSVEDEDGSSYSAKITDTSNSSCQIEISDLQGGKKYSFTISGVAPQEGGRYASVKGRFEAPEVSEDATKGNQDETDEEEEDETTTAATVPSEEESSSDSQEESSSGEESTEESTEKTVETFDQTESESSAEESQG